MIIGLLGALINNENLGCLALTYSQIALIEKIAAEEQMSIQYYVFEPSPDKEKTEMAVEIFCKQADMDFMEKIRAIEHVDDVTLIQYNGEYHG